MRSSQSATNSRRTSARNTPRQTPSRNRNTDVLNGNSTLDRFLR